MRLKLLIVIAIVVIVIRSSAESRRAGEIDQYLQGYVSSGNYAGTVVLVEDGKVRFHKAYGLANHETKIKNAEETQFHIASISMQFTAAAILRLIDTGRLHLDDHVDKFVNGIQGGNRIRIRDLLVQRSGLPDINSLPDYNEILQQHQTAESLVKKIQGVPLLFEPGSTYVHEEHSAYNLLALIVERITGLPFAVALKQLIFQPVGLHSSGVDDDSAAHVSRMARGYEPVGIRDLKAATTIHWSAKTGNGSAYTTAQDLAHWVEALFSDHAVSEQSRTAIADTSVRVGYGWFRGEIKRFGLSGYYMSGRAPGFASFVMYIPSRRLTVVVLSNVYSSATSAIGYDVAAIGLGLPYRALKFREHAPERKEMESCQGTFQFGSDFYVPDAKLIVQSNGSDLFIHWPDGSLSVLIPLEKDHFVDRSYWEEVQIERDTAGHPSEIVYSGFHGRTL